MKKRLLIAALVSMILGGATAQEKFSFKFYGFVRNYACYDTRESLTSNSEQFYYMPKDVKLDADGNDIANDAAMATPMSSVPTPP